MNISKEQFTKLAKEHLIALESYKMDKNGNKPIEIFGIEKLYEAINYTHCCTELKTLKQGEKLILDNKFDVEVVAPSEKNVLIKYKETDRVVWVNEQRLKQK